MLQLDARSLVAGAAGVVLTFLLTLPSTLTLWKLLGSGKARQDTYEDKDGIATKESLAKYTAKVPKIWIGILTVLGLLTSVALAILATLDSNQWMLLENWLNVAQWSLLVVQMICISAVRHPPQSYRLGLFFALSSINVLATQLFQDQLAAQDVKVAISSLTISLHIVKLFAVLFAAIGSVCIPRRPEVYHGGKRVDGMLTTSALGRYTFSWVGDLIHLARYRGRIFDKDLRAMDHYTRAQDLSNAWRQRTHTRRLWIEVIVTHKAAFIRQWALTLLQAFGLFAPQFIIFHILQILEKRGTSQKVGSEAWIWVVTLTITTIAISCIESWMYWICWSELAIPVRSQLSSLIFQKALRRKDVKGLSKTDKKANASDPKENGEGADFEGKQATVNLIGIDAKRVSDFCSFNNYFPGSFFKLIISFTFLINIIGWVPLLCGVAAMCAILPLNIYFSKRYSAAQDRVTKLRDSKLVVITEALQGIRQIKFSALETNWHDKIGKVRNRELAEQWNVFKNDSVLLFCWIVSPIAFSATSLGVYSWIYGNLEPSIAFTAISIFASLETTLSIIPELSTNLIDAKISIDRIQKFLDAPEVSENKNDGPEIVFDAVSIAWPSDEEKRDGDERYVLRDINLTFPARELSVISGKTGSGKSLMLAAILGEVDVLSGKLTIPRPPPAHERHDALATKDNWIIPSSIAFVAQIPWIENASIRDNILFGLPFDETRYWKVIEVCALKQDLAMLADGENTEIGANGINLSGGQRWRVTLARALYSRAGILVLDDIFSAVDAHVGRYIFEKALTGELGMGRTRILVTHHVALVKPKAKYIVELGDGTVEQCGLVQELEVDGTLQKIISHEETPQEILQDQEMTAVNSEHSSDEDASSVHHAGPVESTKVNSKKPTPRKFVEDEKREEGAVKTAVYMTYINTSGGLRFWGVVLIAFACAQAMVTARTWWLRIWTHDSQRTSSIPTLAYTLQLPDLAPAHTSNMAGKMGQSHSLGFYLGIYAALSIVNAIVGTFKYWYVFTGSLRASRQLFDRMCFTILTTPLRFMDTVPMGRIINRFTTDFQVVDGRLGLEMNFCAHNTFLLLGIMVAGCLVSPWVILMSLVLMGVCIYIAIVYIKAAREVKRLESIARSPVLDQLGSAIAGVGTIRAFDKADTYITRMFAKIDAHTEAFWHLWVFNRWMGWRMSFVSGLFSSFICVVVLLLKDIDASLAGFALSFSIQYSLTVFWAIRHYTNVELHMNAAERIVEYSNLATESREGIKPPAHWPAEGVLEVNDLVIGYAPDLDPVLNGVTFRIERNERVGVVGRTGAGKSSLTLALFRFLEARSGSIHIDGIDISRLKLYNLRKALAIIPQDPVLFSGTIRSNLDPFNKYRDGALHDALLRVHLVGSSLVASLAEVFSLSDSDQSNKNVNPFTDLSSPITEGGLNLSQGQRQLLCLARAIISRPKIMVLDEATSAVDMETDALIQRSIREEFTRSTLLVIAHRLSTIVDFDKILVLDAGKVVEFGKPKELMAIEGGVFRGMVEESGERIKLEAVINRQGAKAKAGAFK
ncbi:hypothetical protein HYFRA_00006436 [Hymenoscyphus fraxineus]|uniref:Uncharacterized protein n=1 Tax=Hymenoscyphus fraxineus TaxID=746836 RepID=A0A9N9PPY0_9HELO|nr:hypothetical protein HYFRA_00006436 [Hymenoscyphus fraxineus]